ncbi:MAG: DUF99 family protein [Candidatus Asgardarchaeia archaeon]
MKIHLSKKGIRSIGIAESFVKTEKKAVIVGIVMRSDWLIDGFNIDFVTVGGLDATEKVINLISNLSRTDITVILLNGTVISWYNIIDLEKVFNEFKIPVIALSYRESEGIEKYILENFPEDAHKRLEILQHNNPREKVRIKTGFYVYINFKGIDKKTAIRILNKYTLIGKYPEPIRVARIIANKLYRKLKLLDVGVS